MLCDARDEAALRAGKAIRNRNIALLTEPAGAVPAEIVADWTATTGSGVNAKMVCTAGWKCPFPGLLDLFRQTDASVLPPYYTRQNQWESSVKLNPLFSYNRMHFHILHAADAAEHAAIEQRIAQGTSDMTEFNAIDTAWELLANRQICTFAEDMINTITADRQAQDQTQTANDALLATATNAALAAAQRPPLADGAPLATRWAAYSLPQVRPALLAASAPVREAYYRTKSKAVGARSWTRYEQARTAFEAAQRSKPEILTAIRAQRSGAARIDTLNRELVARDNADVARDAAMAARNAQAAALVETPLVATYDLHLRMARSVAAVQMPAMPPAPVTASILRRNAWVDAARQRAEAALQQQRALALQAQQAQQAAALQAQQAAMQRLAQAPASRAQQQPQAQWLEPYRSPYTGPSGAAAVAASPPLTIQPAPRTNLRSMKFKQRARQMQPGA